MFQSTLPRRERLKEVTHVLEVEGFNPRSHEGSDKRGMEDAAMQTGFNPRSHEGSDNLMMRYSRELLGFNPRSHEGSDLLPVQTSCWLCSFNPRSHEGSDAFHNPYSVRVLFQSTLPRRERLTRRASICQRTRVSIHAPTKGATLGHR